MNNLEYFHSLYRRIRPTTLIIGCAEARSASLAWTDMSDAPPFVRHILLAHLITLERLGKKRCG